MNKREFFPFHERKQRMFLRERMQARISWAMNISFIALLTAIIFGLTGGVVYAVIHFIVKYW